MRAIANLAGDYRPWLTYEDYDDPDAAISFLGAYLDGTPDAMYMDGECVNVVNLGEDTVTLQSDNGNNPDECGGLFEIPRWQFDADFHILDVEV